MNEMSPNLLMLIAFGLFPSSALSTIQERDLLILEGQRIYTNSIRLHDAFPDIKFPEFSMISTANWGGYRATWATFQKQLYLVGLEARVDGMKKLSRNNEIIPKHSFPLKVTTWSGSVVQVERSSSLDVDTMNWTDITETTTISVKNGVVKDTKVTVDRKPRKPNNDSRDSL